MKCPNCGSPVETGAESCTQCSSRITWSGDEATFSDTGSLVRVFTAWDPATLPIIESLLEANEIPFFVANEVTQDFYSWGRFIGGFNPAIGPPVVRVPIEREEEARELISSAATVPMPDDETLP